MKARPGHPDPSAPLVRRLVYGFICWLNRHPRLIRAAGAWLRAWPSWGGARVAARRVAVEQVLSRPASFANTSHAPNLVAGDFLIGMEPGPRYDADKAVFKSVLASLNVQADADLEARRRIQHLGSGPHLKTFDLVEQYLVWVVLRALVPGFGAAADMVVAGTRDCNPDEKLALHYMLEVRHVAANLFGGASAPADVQRRAEMSAASLHARMQKSLPELSMSWRGAARQPFEALHRNAMGLAWVSHPVTVQAAALVVQELLGRRAEYQSLRKEALALGEVVWTDAGFRTLVRQHVLELMRFRPVFPALARDVPRQTEFMSGARPNPVCPAGSSVTVLSLSAMFDQSATPDADAYHPQRDWGKQEAARYLMFGFGDRQCPAKEEALGILTSALIGVLTLPELRLAGPWGRPVQYDGPMVRRMYVCPR